MIRIGLPRTARIALQRARWYQTSNVCRKATAFDMPAMSPTMTEGGIVQWAVKQGESYAAGDMLLEIETDKAQIAVEAQDDGVMAKIIVPDGTKEIPVGTLIAVIAEPGDDLASINYDEIVGAAKPAAKSEPKKEPQSAQPAKPAEPKKNRAAAAPPLPKDVVLLPSVLRLVHQLGVDVSSIKGTGPEGRVLKGDVLAAAGEIPADWPAKEAKLIAERTHLNLSYEAAPKKEAVKKAKEEPAPLSTQAIIDLAALLQFSASQGFSLDRSIAKASRLATRDAILAAKPKPSVLRDRAFDALCAPQLKVPFSVNLKVLKTRAVPKALQVDVTVPPQLIKRGDKMSSVYLERLSFYLSGAN